MLFGPALDELGQLGVAARADHHLQRHILVAGRIAAASPAVNALAAQPQPRAGIRTRRDRHRHRSGDGRHRHPRAEHRFGEADRQLDMDVVALAAEEGVRRDMHFDQCITGRAAAKAGAALALQAQHLTLVDAGRDRHVEPFSGRQREALARVPTTRFERRLDHLYPA